MLFRPVRPVRPLAVAVAGLALLLSAATGRADTVSFTGGVGGATPVSFSGTLDVVAPGSGTSAAITVTLKNTTPGSSAAATYGFITGFGLNVPNNLTVTGATGSSTDTDFKLLTAAANATGLQGGEFDYAFSTNASQLHTVTNAQIPLGLGAGQSATFVLNLVGSGLSGLTAAQIIQELSAPSPAVPFSVRFRSTNTTLYPGGNSPDGDKVPLDVKSVKPVPAPPGAVLAAVGVGALALRRFRRS